MIVTMFTYHSRQPSSCLREAGIVFSGLAVISIISLVISAVALTASLLAG